MITRRIRSFVRREGRMTVSQQRALEKHWSSYGVDFSDTSPDFSQLFACSAPVVFEIGFGMGHSLLHMAKEFPEYNYLGVDVYRPGVGALFIGLNELGLDNVRVFNADAVEVLEQAIPDESLGKVLIFFPDPWPKKKHHKRRLIQLEFVELVRRKLVAGGILHFATDWENYAEHMLKVMTNAPGFVNSAGEGNYVPRPEYRSLTKFERRGQKLGHGVWDLVFVKTE